MLKLIYEGDKLYALMDQIPKQNFVILDWDNYQPFQTEDFMLVLDDPSGLARLDELPPGHRVYLSPEMRARVNRADYPKLKFQMELMPRRVIPARIQLSGEWIPAFDFCEYILKQVPFCVGYRAEGEVLKYLKQWRKSSKYAFLDQFTPEKGQNLVLDFTSAPEISHQIWFWNGRPESMAPLWEGTLTTGCLIVNVGRRIRRSEYKQLPYIYHLPQQTWRKRRAYAKIWQGLLDINLPEILR